MTPTAEAIRTMNGRQLTTLAWTLELAPTSVKVDPDHRTRYWVPAPGGQDLWRPHERLDQADAVFRGLRGPQWELRTVTRCGSNRVTFGRCEAIREDALKIMCDWIVPTLPDQDTEALALLRCAVLARASEEVSR